MAHMIRRECWETDNGLGIGSGLVIALQIAVSLWVILGIVLALVFQHGPIGESASAALMIAATCEAILVRPYARTLFAGIRRYAALHRADSTRDRDVPRARPVPRVPGGQDSRHSEIDKVAGRHIESIEDLLRHVEPKQVSSHRVRREIAPNALLRQSLSLSGLAGAYLQYYFVEVNLQIASLHSLTVFLPVT